MFASITLGNWRQFDLIELDFDRRATVLTGANASGKTTVLNLLSRHFGWQVPFVGAPGLVRQKLRPLRLALETPPDATPAPPVGWTQRPIGLIRYADGSSAMAILQEPPQGAIAGVAGERVVLSSPQSTRGLNIPSHRATGGYQPVTHIPTHFNQTEQVLQAFVNESRNRYMGVGGQQGRSPLYWLKEALLAAAVYGEGNSSVGRDAGALRIWTGFQEILRQLFPETLRFQRLYVRAPDIVVSTHGGDFALDALSGGLMAMAEVAWQVFLRSLDGGEFVVCIDEPENHLHPALQRIFLPRLLGAFPMTQFIVATHSPFIVSSLPDAKVFVLHFNEEGLVISSALDFRRRAATANEVLRDVLGLETTLPVWAEERLRRLVDEYSRRPITTESLTSLREELASVGLEEVIPAAIAEVAASAPPPDDPAE